MNNNRRGMRVALAACLIAAGCAEDEPDPRVFARELQRQAPGAWSQPAQPIVAEVAFEPATAPPAPLAEPRVDLPQPKMVSVLVGNGAAHALGANLRLALPDVPCVPSQCPDRDAIELMMQGRADFAVIAGQLSPRDQHAGLRGTQLGVELWGIAVPAGSPVRSLTRLQLRKVLTGETRDFAELGHAPGAIRLLVPADPALAQRAAKALVPGDPLTGSGRAVRDEETARAIDDPSTIAVVRVGATPLAADARLVSIDWCTPSADAFRYGTYPFGAPITLVTSGQPAGHAAAFAAFAKSPAGRDALARTMLVAP